MFWLRNKKNKFLLPTLIWGPELVLKFTDFFKTNHHPKTCHSVARKIIVLDMELFSTQKIYVKVYTWRLYSLFNAKKLSIIVFWLVAHHVIQKKMCFSNIFIYSKTCLLKAATQRRQKTGFQDQ